MIKKFELLQRVYWEDTDAGGVVYYANYLKFMERCRTEWLRFLGVDQLRLRLDRRLQFAVVSVAVDFLLPAVLNDEIIVTAELERLSGATISFKQTIMRGEDQLIDASTRVACLDSGTLKPRAIPTDLFLEWRNGQRPVDLDAGARRESHRAGGHRAADGGLGRIVGRHFQEGPRDFLFDTACRSVRNGFLVGRGSVDSVPEHRDQGTGGDRRAKHLRVGFRRIQPVASTGVAHRSAARRSAPRHAGGANARTRPARAQSGHAGDRRIHQSICRFVRHRLGDHERLSQPG